MAKKVEKKKSTKTDKDTKTTKKVERKEEKKPEKKVESKKTEVKKEVVKETKKDRSMLFAIIGIALVVVLAVACFLIPNNDDKANEDDKVLAIMTIKDYGDVVLELDRGVAPITVNNFLELANSGFYDGTSFYRVVKNFMIQGGAAKDDINGGSDKTIKGEFEANGVKNDISHVRGTLSMARGEEMDSASSQFFICNADSTYLDGYYAGFGKVVSGMDIIDKITEDVGSEDQSELVPEDKRPIIESIREVVNYDSSVE